MANRVKLSNILFAVLLAGGVAGTTASLYRLHTASTVNQALRDGSEIHDDDFAYQGKFAEAYHQGSTRNYKHAVQSYSQLLENASKQGGLDTVQQAHIQFNIGNNLFHTGLQRLVNSDGTLQDEAKYAYTQAVVAYEQALKLQPALSQAKFNLSLLHTVIPANMQIGKRGQTGMALSNLPLGLP